MPLSIGEGIANGVGQVRECVRYQIRHGAQVIKVSASGGVMSHSTGPGSQQYSDEELAAIADEAHRAGLRVAAHAVGDSAIRGCIRAGIDCIEHGFLAEDDTLDMMAEHGTFLVSTTYLTDAMDIERAAPELQKKAAEVFPKATGNAPEGDRGWREDRMRDRCSCRATWRQREGARSPRRTGACRPRRRFALPPITERRAHRERRRARPASRLAISPIIIAVPGDPTDDIKVTQDVRFVMKDGRVFRND